MDNLSVVLIGFLALLLIILVINIINAIVGNSQRKKARSAVRDRVRGDMDRVNDEYHGRHSNVGQYRNSSQVQHRNRTYTKNKQNIPNINRAHSHTQQAAHHNSTSHVNYYSGGRSQL